MLQYYKFFPRRSFLSIFFMAFLLYSNPLASQNNLTREQINQLSRSIVQITVPDGTGSGIVVNSGEFIYTNRHVMQGFDTCTIAILENVNKPAVEFFKAQLVSFSPDYDFAILKIVADIEGNEVSEEFLKNGNGESFKGFPAITFASDEECAHRGDEIALLGFPSLGEGELFFTRGVVSSVREEEFNGVELAAWYRTTAEMSVGNSGGMAVNENGHIIGMPSNVRSESVTNGKLGNVLSIQMINAVIRNNSFLVNWEDFKGADINGRSLDFNLETTFGEQTIDSTFGSTPLVVDVTSGGEVNADYLGEGCLGFASPAPDVKMHWQGGPTQLTLRFTPKEDSKDATLMVRMPDGTWKCNDDEESESTNPGLTIDNPQVGTYHIWVGSYTEGEYIEGALSFIDPAKVSDISKTILVSKDLDYEQEPYYATMRFSSGFTPNPFSISGQSGGEVDITKTNKGIDCAGFMSAAPDFRLHWTGNTEKLFISFKADSTDMDPVMVINTPEGTWICNDNFEETNLNPGILLKDLKDGQFDIWIGSNKEGEFINGELVITEQPSDEIPPLEMQP